MRRAFAAACSECGPKESNEDAAFAVILKSGRCTIPVVAVCDGVGSSKGAGIAAESVLRELRAAAARLGRRYQRRRGTGSQLWTAPLGSSLEMRLHNVVCKDLGLTTIALGVAIPDVALVAWAGDSRVYRLSRDGSFECLTEDQVNEDGRLTAWVGAGSCGDSAPLRLRVLPAAEDDVWVATTDGIHTAATHLELREFVLYATGREFGHSRGAFADSVRAFVGDVAHDNYSIAIAGGAARRSSFRST